MEQKQTQLTVTTAKERLKRADQFCILGKTTTITEEDAEKQQNKNPDTERFKRTLIYFNTDTQFSGKFPLSTHKTTLKQQINGQKR